MGSELSAHQKLLLEMLERFLTLYVAGMVFLVSAVCRERVGRGRAQWLLFLGMMIWT